MVHVARGNQTESGRGALPTPTKRTPGPWIATPYLEEDEAPGFSIIAMIEGQDTPTNGQVAFVTTAAGAAFDDVPIARANAQLIAAAPELLKVCRELIGAIKDGSIVRSAAFESDDIKWLKKAARTAIAKATGQ